mmetsp:Transcript_30335/g.44858  ORF Transcript_30335/g.44858 Transcript_30335/m.44858 type:complete len:92 (-) Transcript_30335:1114-1389(-)
MASIVSTTHSKEPAAATADDVRKIISFQGFVERNHPLFWHGRIFAASKKDEDAATPTAGKEEESCRTLTMPTIIWQSPENPQDDHNHGVPD